MRAALPYLIGVALLGVGALAVSGLLGGRATAWWPVPIGCGVGVITGALLTTYL